MRVLPVPRDGRSESSETIEPTLYWWGLVERLEFSWQTFMAIFLNILCEIFVDSARHSIKETATINLDSKYHIYEQICFCQFGQHQFNQFDLYQKLKMCKESDALNIWAYLFR